MRLRHLLLPPLVALLAGCFPGGFSYYRPQVDRGAMVKGYCFPIESGVNFTVDLIPIHARVDSGKGGEQVLLRLKRISWPTLFNFTSARFSIRDPATGKSFDDLAVAIDRDDQVKSVTLPFPQSESIDGRLVGDTFSIEVMLPDSVPGKFELVSPPLMVDGKEHKFPVITFERKIYLGIIPFNC